ncbi:hypothetical protein B0H13DRAFT_2393319 [Mycena leptocephala]|nr:hypothetical protein B0H13DRAFT_2393319 [Mycena leptocephala]
MGRKKSGNAQGRQSDFTGEKEKWLDTFKEEILACGADKDAVGNIYTNVTVQFLNRYGYDLPLKENVEDPENNPPSPMVGPLSSEEETRRVDLKQKLRVKLGNWFRNRYRGKKVHESAIRRILASMRSMSGTSQRPRRKPAIAVYSKKHYTERIKPRFDVLWATAKETLPAGARVSMSQDFVRKCWKEEDDAFKEEIEAEAVRIHQEEMEEWEGKRAAPEQAAEDYHDALEGLDDVGIPLADALAELLGAHVAILVVGPVGSAQGEVLLRSVFSDTSKRATTKTWPKFDRKGFTAMEASVTRYGRALFTKAECRERAWPPIGDEAGPLPAALNGLLTLNDAAPINNAGPLATDDAAPMSAIAAAVPPPATPTATPLVNPSTSASSPPVPPTPDSLGNADAIPDGIDRSFWPRELISLHAHLSEKPWGAEWTYLIEQLVYFQWAFEFCDDGFPLSSRTRPAEIAQWMKEHRVMGDYAVGADFGQRLLEWWKTLGPRGRWDENLPESGWPSTHEEDHDVEGCLFGAGLAGAGGMECWGGGWDWRGEAALAADATWSFLVKDVALVLRKGGERGAKGKEKKGKGKAKAKGKGKEMEKEKEPRKTQGKRKAAEDGESSRPAKRTTRSGVETPPPPPLVERPRPRPRARVVKKGVAEDVGGGTPGNNDGTAAPPAPAPAPATAAAIIAQEPGPSPAEFAAPEAPTTPAAAVAKTNDAAAINIAPSDAAASMEVDPPGTEIPLGKEAAGVGAESVEDDDPFAKDPESSEHWAWKPSYITLENAVPSDRQRALFAQSGYPALQATPFTGRCCALQEGDFVVVVVGEHTGKTGFIVVLTEMKQKDPQTKRDRLVHVAAVLERYNGTDAISQKSLESKENPCFAAAIQCLRRHVLSTPHPLSIDDRVAVVAGAARGSSGRVESISDDGAVTILVSGAERSQVEMRHVRRNFRVCDVVEIIRGPKQGTAGFVVEVHTGGFIVFYPCTIPRMFNAMSDGYSFNREAIQPHTIYEDPTHLEQSTPFAVTNSNLKFIPIDAQGFAAKPPAEFYASPTMQTVAQNRALYNKLHTKWELDRMHTGRWFEGMFVQVGGKHPRKGIFGVVKGFRLHALPSQLKMRGQLPDITLRIQQDASLAEFDAKLNQLWDRYTNLPLQQALYFRKLGPINLWKKAEPVAEPVVEPVSWPEVCVVPEPAPTKFGFAPFIGETNGGWLLQPEFVNKRIDVKVTGVKGCLPTHAKKINPKTFVAEGKVGYLTPFPVPLNQTKLDRENLEVRLESMSHPTKIPPGAIRPHRRTLPDPTTGLDQCISAAVGRVIIIGPDVFGSRQRVGQYAETIPASIQHGSPVVDVRFPLESGGRPPKGTYHLKCLCRSCNVTLDAWNIPATDFDALFDPVWAQEGWTKSAKTTKGK